MFKQKPLLLNKENIGAVTAEISAELLRLKASKDEAKYAELLLEETFMRMHTNNHVNEMFVTAERRLGDINMRLECEGGEYNPLIEATDFDEEDADYFRTLILKAHRSQMNYIRKNGRNVVIVAVHKASGKQIYYTLIGMALGILCGIVMKEFLTPDTVNFFDKTIVKSFRSMFLNALNMMIAPVIFFSVISGVTSITNAADIGRIGGKLIGFYSLTTIAASFLSVVIGYTIFSGDVPQIGTVGASGQAPSFSLITMLVGIVPKNLVDPVVTGNMLQIIFMAVVFGICLNKLGDSVKILNELIAAMNKFCLRMITLIVYFIPFIAFLSMASLIFNIGLDSVLVLGELVAGQLVGSFVMVAVYVLLLVAVGHITPWPFLRKIPAFLPIPLSTSSSNATIPFTMKFCTNKMGIAPKLTSFSIPVGATVNMDGGCFYLSIASIMLARMYGVDLNVDVLFTIFVTVVALSIGAPGVPGGAFVCLASIVAALGLPAEATAIILGIDPICSMLRTTLNTVGDIVAGTVLACNENLIDKSVYLKM